MPLVLCLVGLPQGSSQMTHGFALRVDRRALECAGEMEDTDFYFIIIICPHCAACRILVPQPGIEPDPSTLEAWNLNYWTVREVPSQTSITES